MERIFAIFKEMDPYKGGNSVSNRSKTSRIFYTNYILPEEGSLTAKIMCETEPCQQEMQFN
jgi:hypothetical protein